MANIYEITDDYLEIQELMEEGEMDATMLRDTLESIDYDFEDKAENCAKIMLNFDVLIEGIKVEEKRLANKRKVLENSKSKMKNNLENGMKLTGKTKFKKGTFAFRIQKNPPSLDIKSEENIPKDFYEPQEPKLKRKELLTAIKNGLKIEGVTTKQSEGLRIG